MTKQSLNDQIAERILRALNRSRVIQADTSQVRQHLQDWHQVSKTNKGRLADVISEIDAIAKESMLMSEEMSVALSNLAETSEIEMELVSILGNTATVAKNWRVFAAGDPRYLASVLDEADEAVLTQVVNSLADDKKEIIRKCL